MRECEATGKTIEQAVQNALLELKAAREDCDIKILSEGGFLKKAKVLVSISPDAMEKYEKKDKIKKMLDEEENEENFAENFLKKKNESVEAKNEQKPAKNTEKTEKNGEKTQKAEDAVDAKSASNAEATQTEKAPRKVRIVTDEEISSPAKSEKEDKETEEKETFARERKSLVSGEEFLQGVLDALGLDGQIEKTEDDRFLRYSLTGENLNDLIGRHGECMLALSQLMNFVCESNHKKFVLDVEHYRAKREESLTALAKRTADKVAKTGRYFKFEPMDASERKIIHTALQDDDRVTTLSKGEEPRRYLIVFPKEYDERN